MRVDEARTHYDVTDGVARMTLENPGRRNALTWKMYAELAASVRRASTDPEVRAVVLRGTPEDGFAAGTDIAQFTEFSGPDDGVAYERRVGEVLAELQDVTVPVIALVEGNAVGAGLALALGADVVIAERGARFGVPIVRTLGNCLPPAVVDRLVRRLGAPRALSILLGARLLPAEDLVACGFVAELVEPGHLDEAAGRWLTGIARSAPRSLAALKEMVSRVEGAVPLPDGEDLIAMCYGSEDFAEGVRAFLDHRHPEWNGR